MGHVGLLGPTGRISPHGPIWHTLVVTHTGRIRGDSNRVFGSQMFTAAADFEWKLSAVHQDNSIYMKLISTKANEEKR